MIIIIIIINNNNNNNNNNEVEINNELPTLHGLIQGYSMESRLCGRLCLFEEALIAIENAIRLAENEILLNLEWKRQNTNNEDRGNDNSYLVSFRNHAAVDHWRSSTVFAEYQKEHVDLYTIRGNMYSNLDEFGLGFQDSDLCVRLAPNSNMYVNRAFAFFQLQKYQECVQDCNIGLHLWKNTQHANPDQRENLLIKGLLYGNRGIAEKKLNEYQKAIVDLNKCIEIVPQSRVAREMLREIWDEVVDVLYNQCKHITHLVLPKEICAIIAFHTVGIDFELNEQCHPSTMVFGK
ncbi:TPR repeat-containing protein [Reticulomyxa filosa]|uniref:TPR repeat-containing protein n=1 Tax=Reticulomyxa filosa TaxID=46433 RepID=X6NBL0_RETFI|nr:TPR repeat-containing protein [Reticulomyxa filosa]|eukprot:ETO22712.1 TPR repeat-containing protein [Reticulomyxa filosa]